MKRTAAILFAASALLPFATHAQNRPAANPGNVADANDPAVKAALVPAGQAAERWLAQADANNWDACWDALAPAAQGQIGKDGFTGALSAVRAQFGPVKARHARTVTFTHKLPGAPDGDYVVLQYDTDFANGKHAVETVTPMRLPDGSWKVSGYFVR